MPLYAALEDELTTSFRKVLGPESEIYAGLLAALFIGVTFGRHIARAGVLSDLSPEALARYLAPAVRALLAPASAAAESPQARGT